MKRTLTTMLMLSACLALGCGDDDGSNPAGSDAGPESGSGGSPSGGTGGRSGAGGSGGSGVVTGGSGGTGGTTPGTGGQLDPCTSDADCAAGLVCYTFGGFCSAQCAEDSDCDMLGGGSDEGDGGADDDAGGVASGYTCYVPPMGGGSGVCRVECTDASDTTSCPDGLTCVDVGMSNWRCALQ